eukprot:GHVQ01024736.1.p1 GENE.GHVQ01024736.1~~GHVQ01024736.1.p1  ORF type:complete len:367 (+),score=26.14 GHVQ01024736.1:691-1791(+)
MQALRVSCAETLLSASFGSCSSHISLADIRAFHGLIREYVLAIQHVGNLSDLISDVARRFLIVHFKTGPFLYTSSPNCASCNQQQLDHSSGPPAFRHTAPTSRYLDNRSMITETIASVPAALDQQQSACLRKLSNLVESALDQCTAFEKRCLSRVLSIGTTAEMVLNRATMETYSSDLIRPHLVSLTVGTSSLSGSNARVDLYSHCLLRIAKTSQVVYSNLKKTTCALSGLRLGNCVWLSQEQDYADRNRSYGRLRTNLQRGWIPRLISFMKIVGDEDDVPAEEYQLWDDCLPRRQYARHLIGNDSPGLKPGIRDASDAGIDDSAELAAALHDGIVKECEETLAALHEYLLREGKRTAVGTHTIYQ